MIEKDNHKKEDDWSNILLVNLACLVIGFIISIELKPVVVFGLSLTFFVTSMINYAISSRSSKNYLAWDRMGLFCLIARPTMLILAFVDLLSNLH